MVWRKTIRAGPKQKGGGVCMCLRAQWDRENLTAFFPRGRISICKSPRQHYDVDEIYCQSLSLNEKTNLLCLPLLSSMLQCWANI